MNGCFDNQLPAVVFDGVKTSRMLSCEAVTVDRLKLAIKPTVAFIHLHNYCAFFNYYYLNAILRHFSDRLYLL